MTLTTESYRDAMARLGAAVSVITTDGAYGRCGFTASAVCSVTDDPPTLLVCMHRDGPLNGVFKAHRVMCVNVLTSGQRDLSPLFAGLVDAEMAARFARADWSTLSTGAPVLQGAVASFDCRIAQITEIGTHSVLFGEVTALSFGAEQDGLIYFGRAYHSLISIG